MKKVMGLKKYKVYLVIKGKERVRSYRGSSSYHKSND